MPDDNISSEPISDGAAISSGALESPPPICPIIDRREQLFNGGLTGLIKDIQVSTERVVQINGILLDIDPGIIKTGSILPNVPQDPHEFYATVLHPWLNRHDVLARAEVRISGTGLHVILWLAEPAVFNSDADRDHWVGVIKVVQCALSSDPDQPHITAVTRPVGSVNSKNGAAVSQLIAGTPLPVADVVRFYEEMAAAPFRTVMNIFCGAQRLEPCPICQRSRLSALDHVGQCYGSCGKVKLAQLYELVLAPRNTTCAEDGKNDAAPQ